MLEERISETANKPPVWLAPPEIGIIVKLSNEGLMVEYLSRKLVSPAADSLA